MNARPPSGTLPDTSRWRRIEAVLDRALELDAGESAAYVETVCSTEPELRDAVLALLKADASAGDFLAHAPLALAAELLEGAAGHDAADGDAAGMVGRRIGPWRIVRELGRGGMGVVYLAGRDDGAYRQSVALKRIRRGLDTDEILARFRRERQILARLEHPHIARLLDGGATDEGLPYLVMEYVEGETITAWCARHGAGLDARLRLFAQVCAAVQHAHRNLVVHRDLKPSNILVTEGGEVKLLDFGVARLIASDDADFETTMGTRRLTPHYAAPEQVRGDPPTTATDVYALGVVLYELLTGERPYRRTTGSLRDLERAVLEESPRPPSEVAPAGDRARLRGDLDNVVLMALRKEPGERYPSADAMLDDLERFRAGAEVRATRSTWSYRARKFVGRNRAAVAVGAAIALALAGGVVATTRQARIAQHERDRALTEAHKASEIKDFVVGLFAAANPYDAVGPDLTAADLVRRGVTRVRTELAGQPEVQAELLDVLGGVFREFQDFARAESLVTEGLDIRRRLFGPSHPLVARSLNSLGFVRYRKGDYPGGERVIREALEIRRALVPPDTGAVLTSVTDLAVLLAASDRKAEAESLYREGLAIAERQHGPDHPEVALQLNNLGAFLLQQGRLQDAVPMLERAVDIRRRRLGPDHLGTAISAELLANGLAAGGGLERADSLYGAALAARRRWLDPRHPDLARPYDSMARLAEQMGRFARAESLFLTALALRRDALGPEHPDVGITLNNLAVLRYAVLRDLDGAGRTFEQVHALWAKSHGENHASTLTALANLGAVRREEGRLADSDRIMRDALERRMRAFGDSSVHVAASWYNIAQLRRMQGRLDEAERLARGALHVRERELGAASAGTVQTQEVLATILRVRGRADESLPLYRAALATCRTLFKKPTPLTADVLLGMGQALTGTGKAAEAKPLLEEAVGIRAGAFPPADVRTADARAALARCDAAIGAVSAR